MAPHSVSKNRTEPVIRIDQLPAIESLRALRVLDAAMHEGGCTKAATRELIPQGSQRKRALEPLLQAGLIREYGPHPRTYLAEVRWPRLPDGSVGELLADPDTAHHSAILCQMAAALGARIETSLDLAKATGLDKRTAQPYLVLARTLSRVLHELPGIVQSASNSESTGVQSASQKRAETAQIASKKPALMPATAAVTPQKGVNPPAVPSPEPDHPPDPPSDPDFARDDPTEADTRHAVGPDTKPPSGGPPPKPGSRSHLAGSWKVIIAPSDRPTQTDVFGLRLADKVVRGQPLDATERRQWSYREKSGAANELLAEAQEALDGQAGST